MAAGEEVANDGESDKVVFSVGRPRGLHLGTGIVGEMCELGVMQEIDQERGEAPDTVQKRGKRGSAAGRTRDDLFGIGVVTPLELVVIHSRSLSSVTLDGDPAGVRRRNRGEGGTADDGESAAAREPSRRHTSMLKRKKESGRED
nr:hypothetical protein CFP56_79538 [Quercus suber]